MNALCAVWCEYYLHILTITHLLKILHNYGKGLDCVMAENSFYDFYFVGNFFTHAFDYSNRTRPNGLDKNLLTTKEEEILHRFVTQPTRFRLAISVGRSEY